MPNASLAVKLTLMLLNSERKRNSTILREFVALCKGYALPTFDYPENMKNSGQQNDISSYFRVHIKKYHPTIHFQTKFNKDS